VSTLGVVLTAIASQTPSALPPPSDLTSAVAWAQIIATIVTGIGVVVAILTVWSQGRQVRFSATVDNLWRFDDQWRGPDFRALRLAAAAALKTKNKNAPQIFDILGFFEMLGLMTRKGAIDIEVVSNNFGYWAINYWHLCEPTVTDDRDANKDPSLWQEYEGLVNSLAEMTTKSNWFKFPIFAGIQKPSDNELQDFLANESKLMP
jgi:hypothetical protein